MKLQPSCCEAPNVRFSAFPLHSTSWHSCFGEAQVCAGVCHSVLPVSQHFTEDPATDSTQSPTPRAQTEAQCNRCSCMHGQAILVLKFVITSPLLLFLIASLRTKNNLSLKGPLSTSWCRGYWSVLALSMAESCFQ